jgi:hypothetical protein
MKFEIRRDGIVVIPENDQDRAYIEDTLGLKKDGEYILLTRKNAHGLGSIAYLETVKRVYTQAQRTSNE